MPAPPDEKSVRRRLIDGAKREARVFFKTFGIAWFAIATALFAYAVAVNPHFSGTADFLVAFTVGFVMMLFYAFWPAVGVASVRLTYRLVGLAAFIPIPVVVLGIVFSFWLFGGWLRDLLHGLFASLTNVGPCGAHAGGPVALFCLAVAILGSRAGIWALLKLLFGLSLVIVAGALPGIVLFVVLVARAIVVRLRKPALAAQSAAKFPA